MSDKKQSLTANCTNAIPCLRYGDAPAAIDWLVRVFGADAREVHPGPNGSIMHAELWFGSGCIMCGSLKNDGMPPTQPGQGAVYVATPNAATVDALHASAVAAGARIVTSLRDTDYGSHDFGCLDPEGNFWGFGTYAPRGERGM
ncbi:MAG: VOC family protein [Gemmatimonadaceae bacterium]